MAKGDTKTEAMLDVLGNGGDGDQFRGCCNTKTQQYILDAIDRINNIQPGGSYAAGTGIDIANNTISVDTDTIQEKLIAGTGIDITNNTISATGGGGSSDAGKPKKLTSADFNWNSTAGSATEPYDSIAMWLLDAGLYYTTYAENVAVLIDTNDDYLTPESEMAIVSPPQSGFITGNNVSVTIIDGGGNNYFPVYKVNPTTGARNASTRISFGNLPTVVDNLNSISAFAALSANQGRVLKELIDGLVISGAGAPTTSTAGVVGTLYEDTTNGKLYQCTAVSGSTYTWSEVGSGGGTVTDVQVNGTSVLTGGVANVVTETAYNASSNKIATMSDISTAVGNIETVLATLTTGNGV